MYDRTVPLEEELHVLVNFLRERNCPSRFPLGRGRICPWGGNFVLVNSLQGKKLASTFPPGGGTVLVIFCRGYSVRGEAMYCDTSLNDQVML